MKDGGPTFHYFCRSCDFTQPGINSIKDEIPIHCNRPMQLQPIDPSYNEKYLKLATNISQALRSESKSTTLYYCEECGYTKDNPNFDKIPSHCGSFMTLFKPST